MSEGDLFNGLARGAADAVRTVGKALDAGIKDLISDVTGGRVDASAAPSSDTSLSDLRWEGMSNAQLAAAVQQLNEGTGASGMTQAADALANVAADLTQINQTLQTQLQAIGVNWQSQAASELADQMLSASAAYGGTVTDQGSQAAGSINQQAEAYATARNGAPQPQTLLGNTANGPSGLVSKMGSPFTGHSTDQTQQANQANAARSQAVDTLNNYTSSSQSHLSSYSPPPPPPAIGVTAQNPPGGSSGVTGVSGYVPPAGTGPSGGGGGGVTTLPPGTPGGGGVGGTQPPLGGGGLGTPGTPGSPGGVGVGGGAGGGSESGVGFPGGLAAGLTGGVPAGGAPGFSNGGGFATGGGLPGGGSPGSGLPGGGSPGGSNLPTGPISGIGATGGGASSSGPNSAAMSGGSAGAISEDIGNIAGGAAVAGGAAAVGIVGANSAQDKVVKGSGNEPGGFADDEDDFAPRSGIGELDAEQATAARVSASLAPEEPVGPALLEPAVGGRRGDDDAEHRNSYAEDAGDFFDDGRMVVPDVLGGTNDEEKDA